MERYQIHRVHRPFCLRRNGRGARNASEWKAIDELNEKLKPFRVLKAVEAVRSDGSLDFDKSFFDQIARCAPIHQAYRQSPTH